MQHPKSLDELDLKLQFAHARFCKQIEDLSLENTKALLIDLHKLTLNQQTLAETLLNKPLQFNVKSD